MTLNTQHITQHITNVQVEEAYTEFQFYKATQAITTFANMDLSAFYLDIAKDRYVMVWCSVVWSSGVVCCVVWCSKMYWIGLE